MAKPLECGSTDPARVPGRRRARCRGPHLPTFRACGHPSPRGLAAGTPDPLVARTAQANNAILVAYDRDMRKLARRHGVGGGRFARLSLIHLQCPEPTAASRIEDAMSFIEHEWRVSPTPDARRLYVEIGTGFLRTNR